MRGNRCEDEIRAGITKADCCASVGRAWGSPCELCPGPDEPGFPGGGLGQPTPSVGVGPDGSLPVGPG